MYRYIKLREKPELKASAANWFHSKWGVPQEAYLECMDDYLDGKTEYGWYLCLDDEQIVGGLGVIENDFHDRKSMLEKIPEEQVEIIIRYMENVQVVYSQHTSERTLNRAQQAFRNLEKYFGRITESVDY